MREIIEFDLKVTIDKLKWWQRLLNLIYPFYSGNPIEGLKEGNFIVYDNYENIAKILDIKDKGNGLYHFKCEGNKLTDCYIKVFETKE